MATLPELFRNDRIGFSNNPYKEMLKLQRQMDRYFNDFWNELPARNTQTLPSPSFEPACDVTGTESHLVLSFDLPGVKKEDIKIDLQDGILTVSGERKEDWEKKTKNQYRHERFYGSFTRSFQLPQDIKAEQVETTYAEGVLRIAIPKTESSKSHQIKIDAEKPGFWEKLLGHKKDEKSQSQGPSKVA